MMTTSYTTSERLQVLGHWTELSGVAVLCVPVNIADFGFELPDELIAQEPPSERGRSRLLVLDRASGETRHARFDDLPAQLSPGDLLVLNNTRVMPARLLGRRVPSGGAVECLLLRELPTPDSHLPTGPVGNGRVGLESTGVGCVDVGSSCWEALVHPGQKLKPGARVLFDDGTARIHCEILARHFHGRRTVRLWTDDGSDVTTAIERIGHVPLPPYITRGDRPSDRERYQTVYARERGSIAAPTAGLHVTSDLLARLAAGGIGHTEITLHVGYGTFKPVRVDRVEDHVVDPERFIIPAPAAEALTRARREHGRVIAVGTTTTRALESLEVQAGGRIAPASGETRLFVRPGHEFRIVQGLITNFHLPRSSLLMLVAAFAGRDRLLAAYRQAIAARYRFYSYGDAMLIL
jgi:S-adenosylmethionine:tRNA ribosyltransferase-isomerase